MRPNGKYAELNDLLSRLCDAELEQPSWERLETLLLDDPDAQEYYSRFVALDVDLAWRAAERAADSSSRPMAADRECDIDSVSADEEIELPHASFPSFFPLPSLSYPPSTNFVGGPVFSYMVATVVLCMMLLSAWAYKITHDVQEIVNKTPQSTHEAESLEFVFVGQVTNMRDCTWKDDNTATIVGAAVSLGRKYSLSAGMMEITYRSGAVVILEGPCEFEVNSDVGGHLALGKLTARVEKAKPQAVSNPQSLIPNPLFSVTTPTAVVTDLGTEFGVEVAENGDTMSHVFRGSVEVRAIGGAAGDRIVIGKNESARVRRDKNGRAAVSRHVISDAGGFTCRMPQTKSLDVFNTGVNLREGDEDPHWQIVARSDDPAFEPRPAVVTMVKQPWFMPNDSRLYQWVSLASDLPRVPNDVIYTFRTRFELPEIEGQSCNSAVLRCGFMADNHVDAIRLNGRSIEVPKHGRLSPFIRFHVLIVKEGIVPGENVLEFDVANGEPEEEGVGEEGSVSAMALVVELRGFAVYGGLVSEKRPRSVNQPKGKEEVNK